MQTHSDQALILPWGGRQGVLRPCISLGQRGSCTSPSLLLESPCLPITELEVLIPSLSNLRHKPLTLDLRALCLPHQICHPILCPQPSVCLPPCGRSNRDGFRWQPLV